MSATQYQQDAINACLAAFQKRNAYLVADEAGLGKTHIARGVIEAMWNACPRPPQNSAYFNVYYVGSNVALLKNTIQKLIGDSSDYNPITDIDRISMFDQAKSQLKQHQINLFSCSANLIDASKSSGGSKAEWVYYYNRIYRVPLSAWVQAYEDALKNGFKTLIPALKFALNLNFQTSNAPPPQKTPTKPTDDTIEKLRNLYNSLVLRHNNVGPALIIADEFHRYDGVVNGALKNLIVAENKRRKKNNLPAVKLLLLSATPYNIYKADWETTTEVNEIFETEGASSGNAAFQDFLSLLAFLSGEISGKTQNTSQNPTKTPIFVGYENFQAKAIAAPRHKAMSVALKEYVYRNERIDEENGKYHDLPTQAEFLGGAFDSCMQLPKNDAIKRYRSLCAGVCSFPEREHRKDATYEDFPTNKASWLTKDDFIFNTDGKLKTDMLRQNLALTCIQKYNADNGKQLLWVPPTAPLYKPEGVFATHRHYSKLLVFSAYKMVPRFVSGIFSAYVGQASKTTTLSIPLQTPNTVALLAAAYHPKFTPQTRYQDIIKAICDRKFFPLSEKMALYALASPQVCAYRLTQDANKAKNIANAFNDYFASEGIKQSLAQQDITTITELLHYCAQGNLQAMMAEFAHCHGTGWENAMINALKFPAKAVVHAYHKDNYPQINNACKIPIHFAVPFSPDLEDNGTSATGKTGQEAVRSAFNTPFWPMIVSTTSRGQEGFDFDRYSHRIMHYSLPRSPTSFEQRDGRVDRRLSLLARKKMVEMYGEAYAAQYNSTQAKPKCLPKDFWNALLQEPTAKGHAGLSPLWCVKDYKGNLKQERIIPFFPYSNEHIAYKHLLNAKNKYRRAFGLPNEQIGNANATPLKLNNIK